MKKKPERESASVYWAIVGISALLCFALLLTSNFWFTVAIVALGCLHAARYFPEIEAFIVSDPLLVGLRRISPLIILGIFGVVVYTQWLK